MGNLTRVCIVIVLWTIIIANSTAKVDSDVGKKLYAASRVGNLTQVRQLAGDQCTGVNWKNPEDRYATPLHAATLGDHIDIMMFLLMCDADPNQQAGGTVTPLYYSASRNNTNAMMLLLANNADPNIKTNETWGGATPLMIAAQKNYLPTAKILIASRAQLNVQTKYDTGDKTKWNGWTALMYASVFADVNMTATLLEAGSDFNLQGDKGATALHLATKKNKIEQVEVLLQYHADTTLKTKTQDTAKDIAKKNGFMDILKLIEQYTETNTSACVKDHRSPEDDNILPASSNHTLLVLVISLSVVILVLLIIMIVGCIYIIRYRSNMKNAQQNHIVRFQNQQNRESEHIYENPL